VSHPRVYWPGAEPLNGRVELTGDEAHRLRHVLRLVPGEALALFDGAGREWLGQVSAVTKQAVSVSGLTPITPVAEATVPVSLACGVLKGDQMDAVVRDATMLGVVRIVPMRTAHVTVPPRAWQSGAAGERWQRVAAASAAQCRRAVVPDISAVRDFNECLREPAALRVICVEPDGASPEGDWRSSPAPASVQLLIGPEGGWSHAEVTQAVAAGARVMTLGPRTLRAETAPIVALTSLASVWGW